MSDESNVAKTFNVILEDINNNQKTTKSISVKIRGKTISLYLLLTKLVDKKTAVLEELWT